MYNEERKKEYLRHVVEDLGQTPQSAKALFNKTEDYEDLLNKDLCDFTFSEIDKLLSTFAASSINALRKNISVLRKYADWCCSCNISIDNINHYDEINMEIVCELLRNVGAEFATASDGEEAVELFGEAEPFTYDAVLMDIRMPRMNGYQAAAAIRALPRPDAISVVIIAMTADVLENDVEQSLEQGMDAHVAKPFDTRQFLFLLRGLLQNKENMICK